MTSREATSYEEFHGRERLGRPRTEAIQRERSRLPRLHVYQDIVVLLDRTSTFPILVRRVTIGNLDMRPAGKNRILFRAATAQHQVFHSVHLIKLGSVHVPVEDDDVEVLRVRSDRLMGILICREGTHSGAGVGTAVKRM